jgi:predicted transglutaminase-like cysteine proteinase
VGFVRIWACFAAMLCLAGLSACASDDFGATPSGQRPGVALLDNSSSGPHESTARRAAKPPSGYLAFCARNPSQCKPAKRTSELVLTDDIWRELEDVNLIVNRTVLSEDDQFHYGTQEFWTIPEDGYGDCEDYVLIKRRALIKLGLPEAALRITVVFAPHFVRHAVLTVVTDRGNFVLDNLNDEIVTSDKTKYTYLERQDPASASGWVSLQ